MRCSEPATAAYNSLEEVRQSIADLLEQRDTWITRYEGALRKLDEAEAERDYWRQVVFDRGE